MNRYHTSDLPFASRTSTAIGSSRICACSSNPSRPVGFSGAKNFCGRSHFSTSEELASEAAVRLTLPKDVDEEDSGFVGVQSISSPSSSFAARGFEPCNEGCPKTGRELLMTGLEDSDKVESMSFSGITEGNLEDGPIGMDVADCGAGVAERDLSNLCEVVSTRRIEGGR